jgi:hypothetical protein
MTKFLLLFLFLLFNSTVSFATHIDFNLLYFSDSFVAATTNSNARIEYDLGLGTELTNDKQWVVALSTGSASFTDVANSVNTTFINTDTGLKLCYYFTKSRAVGSTITYNFMSKAKYNDGTTDLELRGSSVKADFGYTFWSDTIGISLKLFYYAPSFNESFASGTVTTISYKRTLIYPGISIVFQN